MATLYFNGDVDGDWDELGNWWLNSGHTTPAASLPTSSDSVIASANINSNSGSEPTVVNIMQSHNLGIDLTVTGLATFSGGMLLSGATLTGNAEFTDSVNNGTINGNVTFNGSSQHDGTVNGNVTFNGSSVCNGSVDGHAVFNGTSYVGYPNTLGGTLDSLTFNDYSIAKDIFLSGASITITFNDYAVCDPDSDLNFGNCTIVFNDYSSVSDSFNRRAEGSTERLGTQDSATITFNDNSMYWVDDTINDNGQWTFRNNAVNHSLTNGTNGATFLPSRGINGSSILGLI